MSEAHVAQLLPRPLALEPEVTAANWQRLCSRRSSGASCSLTESRDSTPGAQETIRDRGRDKETHYSVKRDLLQCQKRPSTAETIRDSGRDAAARAHTHMGVMQRGSVGLVDCTDVWGAAAGPSPCVAVGPSEHTVLSWTDDEHLPRTRSVLSRTGNESEDAHARVCLHVEEDTCAVEEDTCAIHVQAHLLVTPVGVLSTAAHEAAARGPVDRQHNSAEKEEQGESSDRVREATAQMPRPAKSLAHIHTYMTVERVKFVAGDEIHGQSNSEWGRKQQV